MIFNIFASKKPVLSPEEAYQQQLQLLWKYKAPLEVYFASKSKVFKILDPEECKNLVITTLAEGARLMITSKYEERGKPLPYLYGIAKHVFFNFYKKARQQQPFPTVELLEEEGVMYEPNDQLKKRIFIEECLEKAHSEVSTAMKVYVKAFESHYYLKIPYKVLAVELNTSVDYVEKKVREIRDLIGNCARKKYLNDF